MLLQFSVGSGIAVLPVLQCWCFGVVCACLCDGNSCPGLLAEPVGCGTITKPSLCLNP